MTTRPNPSSNDSNPSHQFSGLTPRTRGVLTFLSCLTAATVPVDRWLDVINKAVATFEALKASGVIDMITGG